MVVVVVCSSRKRFFITTYNSFLLAFTRVCVCVVCVPSGAKGGGGHNLFFAHTVTSMRRCGGGEVVLLWLGDEARSLDCVCDKKLRRSCSR